MDAVKIGVRKADGRDVSENGVERDITARDLATFQGSMQLPGIVGNYSVGRQRERTGNQNLLLAPPATIRANRSGMDDPFQLMHASPPTRIR